MVTLQLGLVQQLALLLIGAYKVIIESVFLFVQAILGQEHLRELVLILLHNVIHYMLMII